MNLVSHAVCFVPEVVSRGGFEVAFSCMPGVFCLSLKIAFSSKLLEQRARFSVDDLADDVSGLAYVYEHPQLSSMTGCHKNSVKLVTDDAQVIVMKMAWKSALRREPVDLLRPNPFYLAVVDHLIHAQEVRKTRPKTNAAMLLACWWWLSRYLPLVSAPLLTLLLSTDLVWMKTKPRSSERLRRYFPTTCVAGRLA